MAEKTRYTSGAIFLRRTNDKHPSLFFNCLFGQGCSLTQENSTSSIRVFLNGWGKLSSPNGEGFCYLRSKI